MLIMAPAVWLLEIVLWLVEMAASRALCAIRGHHSQWLLGRKVCLSCGRVEELA